MATPSHIRFRGIRTVLKALVGAAFLAVVLGMSAALLPDLSQQVNASAAVHTIPSAHSHGAPEALNDGSDWNTETLSYGPTIIGQVWDAGRAVPLTTLQLIHPTELRVLEWEKMSAAPRMKGFPICHFQSEETSFGVSLVTRVQPPFLRVFRI
jgi:hypothetical protein